MSDLLLAALFLVLALAAFVLFGQAIGGQTFLKISRFWWCANEAWVCFFETRDANPLHGK